MKLFDFFDLAASTAIISPGRRSYLIGAVGVRDDGAIVRAANGACERKNNRVHAEARLARKLDVNSVVYVARVKRGDGEFGNARPCRDCVRAMTARGVKRVYYTLGKTEYGVLDL